MTDALLDRALDAMLQRDAAQLESTRTEMVQASFALGALTSDAVAGLLDRTPLRHDTAERLATAIYALLRVAAAGDVAGLDAVIARLIDRRNADRLRLALHGTRVERALDPHCRGG